MDQKEGRNRIQNVVILVLLAVMLVSGTMGIHNWVEGRRIREEHERLAELVRETTTQPSTEAVTESGTEGLETGPYVSPINFEELMKEDPDTIRQIRMLDTSIDYPIVQGENNDFYPNYDLYGKGNTVRATYLDLESQGDFVGRNNVLYGHNMRNGSMFKDVNRYKNETYFKEHQFFSTYTSDREIRLKTMAACYGETRPIVRKTRLKPQELSDAFVYGMTRPRNCGVEITYLIRTLCTLVTYSYGINDVKTSLSTMEVDEDGKQIQPDGVFLQYMNDLMGDKVQETAGETVQKTADRAKESQ